MGAPVRPPRRRTTARTVHARTGPAPAGVVLGGLALSVLVLAGLAACGGPVEVGHALGIEISAEPASVRAGESVAFRYDAQGRHLVGIVIDYGDGVADTIQAHGAQTAGGNRTHVYEVEGSYTATGEVADADGARATASVDVEVTPSSTQDR